MASLFNRFLTSTDLPTNLSTIETGWGSTHTGSSPRYRKPTPMLAGVDHLVSVSHDRKVTGCSLQKP